MLKIVLQGSELLQRFLTSEEEFTTSFLDVNLGLWQERFVILCHLEIC